MNKVDLPDEYTLGYRSYLPYIEVKLFGPKNDVDNRVKLLKIIHNLIEENVVSVDEPFEDCVAYLIAEKGQSISTAEQSTYGQLIRWLNLMTKRHTIVSTDGCWRERVEVGESNNDALAAILALLELQEKSVPLILHLLPESSKIKRFQSPSLLLMVNGDRL